MDTLHNVLRSITRETKAGAASRRDHLTVFREFLDHLDRVSKRRPAPSPHAPAKTPKGKRGRR